MLAVLISGSWRTGSIVAEHNFRILQESGIPFKIFIHTWAQNVSTFRTPLESIYAHRWYISRRKPIFESFETHIHQSLLLSYYPGSEIKVEEFDPEQFYKQFHFNDSQIETKKYLNSCAMYYGMQQCKNMLEDDDGFENFKYFLRMRPDYLLSREAISEVLRNPLVFIGQSIKNDKGHVSDQCFGGEVQCSLEIMGGIKKLLPVAINGKFEFPVDVAVSGENVLMEHIRDHKKLASISTKFISEKAPFNKIYRPNVVECFETSTPRWLLLCCAHNFKVLVSRVRGYASIISKRVSNLSPKYK